MILFKYLDWYLLINFWTKIPNCKTPLDVSQTSSFVIKMGKHVFQIYYKNSDLLYPTQFSKCVINNFGWEKHIIVNHKLTLVVQCNLIEYLKTYKFHINTCWTYKSIVLNKYSSICRFYYRYFCNEKINHL